MPWGRPCNQATSLRDSSLPLSLPQERLEFDNELAGVEKNIKKRRSDLRELQSMFTDAQLSRDMAKVTPIHTASFRVIRGSLLSLSPIRLS